MPEHVRGIKDYINSFKLLQITRLFLAVFVRILNKANLIRNKTVKCGFLPRISQQ